MLHWSLPLLQEASLCNLQVRQTVIRNLTLFSLSKSGVSSTCILDNIDITY